MKFISSLSLFALAILMALYSRSAGNGEAHMLDLSTWQEDNVSLDMFDEVSRCLIVRRACHFLRRRRGSLMIHMHCYSPSLVQCADQRSRKNGIIYKASG